MHVTGPVSCCVWVQENGGAWQGFGGGVELNGWPWQRPVAGVGSLAPPSWWLLRATPSSSLSLQGVCTMTAAFLHFFFLSSFCWVLTEAWQSYLAVIGRMRTRLVRKRFLCLGWGEQGLCIFAAGPRALALTRTQLWAQGSAGLGVEEGERTLRTVRCLTQVPAPPGLPALVVAVSVGFTRTKGYGTSS